MESAKIMTFKFCGLANIKSSIHLGLCAGISHCTIFNEFFQFKQYEVQRNVHDTVDWCIVKNACSGFCSVRTMLLKQGAVKQ